MEIKEKIKVLHILLNYRFRLEDGYRILYYNDGDLLLGGSFDKTLYEEFFILFTGVSDQTLSEKGEDFDGVGYLREVSLVELKQSDNVGATIQFGNDGKVTCKDVFWYHPKENYHYPQLIDKLPNIITECKNTSYKTADLIVLMEEMTTWIDHWKDKYGVANNQSWFTQFLSKVREANTKQRFKKR